MEQKPPFPPFTEATAKQKIQMAEDAWNSKEPEKVSKAYTVDTEWRNRDEFINGREQVIQFLRRKWQKEQNYRLKKEYWAHSGNRIAVRFEYEYCNASGQWFRAYGNENWEFDGNGLMKQRFASINDVSIQESERKFVDQSRRSFNGLTALHVCPIPSYFAAMKGIWILLAILLGFLVFNYLGPRMIVQVDHLVFRWLRPSKTTAPMPSTLNGEPVQIKTHDGLIQKGVWLKADGNLPKGTLILLHGIRANKEHFWPVAKRLTSDGFCVLLIDMRAHGQSEGKYCTFGFYEKQDVRLWIDYLEGLEEYTGPIGIWGQSLGGAVGLQAMALDQRLQFGVIESTFSDLKTIIHDYNRFFLGFDIPCLTTYLIWRAEGVATFYSQMVRPSESAKLIKQPIFIAHGTDDRRIDISYGKQNFDNVSSVQKGFYAVDGANHLNVWEKGGDAYFSRAFDFIHKAIGEFNP